MNDLTGKLVQQDMDAVVTELAARVDPPRGAASLGDCLTLPCGFRLENRIAKSAMSENLGGRHNRPTDELIRLYERWSRSGSGLLMTGNVMVDRRSLGEAGNVVLEDERDFEAFERWAGTIKRDGAAAVMQLNHPGRQSIPGLSERVVAPSALRVQVKGARFPTPRALTDEGVREQIERFATAAEIAVRAGFDGVQIHAAHGYLHSQFLSPTANVRDDEWGGDRVRRRRFLLETVRAIRRVIGSEAILSIKLNSADFQRGGFGEDESLEVIEALDSEGIDLLEISGGTYARAAMVGQVKQGQKESTRRREAYFMVFAERARAAVEMPLMVTGGLRSAEAMNDALGAGVDVIGLGRPLSLEPDLPAALVADVGTTSSLKPVTTGLQMLDGAAELVWHAAQMRAMANGREPDQKLGARRAVARAVWREGRGILKRRRGG